MSYKIETYKFDDGGWVSEVPELLFHVESNTEHDMESDLFDYCATESQTDASDWDIDGEFLVPLTQTAKDWCFEREYTFQMFDNGLKQSSEDKTKSLGTFSEFVKHDSTKPPLQYTVPEAIEAMAYVLEYGANKYSPDNWRKCKDPSRYVAACLRHILAWQGEEHDDYESGWPHLWHALASLSFAVALELDLMDATPETAADTRRTEYGQK